MRKRGLRPLKPPGGETPPMPPQNLNIHKGNRKIRIADHKPSLTSPFTNTSLFTHKYSLHKLVNCITNRRSQNCIKVTTLTNG